MSIPQEQPPSNTDTELSAWLMRLVVQISGSFEQLELENEQLKERISKLENPTP